MPEPQSRWIALDVFRGATVAGMLLVNNPGSWGHVYAPLLHAEWHGWTPTDLIFPFFLFIVGVTTWISLERQRAAGVESSEVLRRIVRRGLLIVAFGLLLNWFPFYTWGRVPGIDDPSLAERVVYRWEHLRWSGVLQRIGLVYLVSAPLVWKLRIRALTIVCALLLAGYAALLLLVPVPDTGARGLAAIAEPDQTTAAWVDRLVLGRDHIWRGGMWDPEGPLSTIPAIVTALLGSVAARALTGASPLRLRLRRLVLWGAAGMVAGLAWSPYFPINKNLWTSSYVLFTAGFASLLLALTILLVDSRHWRAGSGFFVTFGLNPLVAFLGSGLMARLTDSLLRVRIEETSRPLHAIVHDAAFRSWLPEKPASLAYAISFVLVWFLILKLMERRRWVLKV